MSFWSFKACTFGGFLNSKKWILIWGFFIPPGKYEHSVSILRRWREDGSQDKDQMARLVESVVMTVLTTLMTEMTMTIYSGIWSWALNEELLPQWQELPARGSQHFLAPLLSQKKVLKHLHPLFLVLCLQMPRKRSITMHFSSVSPHVNRWALESMYTCTHQLWTAFCTTEPVPSKQLFF